MLLPSVENALLHVADVARRLGTSEGSVRRRADAGQLPCVKTIRGERLFRADAIEEVRTQERETLAAAHQLDARPS
jgi:predicted site-specific integrase-resolvase